MVLRFTAAIPLIASVVTFALTIVLLVSGTSTGQANGDYWAALNLSGVGGNLVEIQPASASSDSNDPLAGIINGIPGLGSVLDNITAGIGNGISDIQGSILGNLTSALGVKNMYLLYVSKMCEGNFRNPDDINSLVVDACYSYRDKGAGLLKISNSIPSGFTVGTVEVSVPLVKTLQSTISQIVNLAIGAATTMEVLLIIGSIGSGLTALGSLLGFFRAQSRIFTVFNLIFSQLAADVLFLVALIATGVIVGGTSAVGGAGSGLSLRVKEGTSFLAIVWPAAVLSLVAGTYWFAIWFVEFRRSAFSRRSRTSRQIGNWGGIFGEVRRDLKVDGHFPPAGGARRQEKLMDQEQGPPRL